MLDSGLKSHQMLAIRTCVGPGFTRCGSSLIVSADDVKHPPELLQASSIESLYKVLFREGICPRGHISDNSKAQLKVPPK